MHVWSVQFPHEQHWINKAHLRQRLHLFEVQKKEAQNTMYVKRFFFLDLLLFLYLCDVWPVKLNFFSTSIFLLYSFFHVNDNFNAIEKTFL